MNGRHVTEEVTQRAIGDLEADRVTEGIRAEALPEGAAWLRFIELASRYGWRSPACAAYVARMSKRAAA